MTHGIDYTQLTETLYLGTNACCQMHFAQELLAKGINADISLEAERLDSPEGVASFLWLPTPDHTPPSPTQLTLGVQHLMTLQTTGSKTYVHCKNGHGRAPTLLAAYFQTTRAWNTTQTITFLKNARPSIHLEPGQVEALVSFHG
jgi:protein-tyrosine phosphatase